MSSTKLIVNFSDTTKAHAYALRARKLPCVSYATDYSKGHGRFAVMVCGEFSQEQEEQILRKKI